MLLESLKFREAVKFEIQVKIDFFLGKIWVNVTLCYIQVNFKMYLGSTLDPLSSLEFSGES